jgi:hypothetical protein
VQSLGYFERADWDTWAHIPEADLWQVVALSIDVDSRDRDVANQLFRDAQRVDELTPSGREKAKGASPGYEFVRRLHIATANFKRGGKLTPLTLGRGQGPWDDKVSLAQFGAWAKGVGLSLPDRFPCALADPKAADPKDGQDGGRNAQPDELDPREKRGMLAIIYAMALGKFQFDPTAKKNNTAKDIADFIHKYGLEDGVGEQTIRKRLAEAVQMFGPREPTPKR